MPHPTLPPAPRARRGLLLLLALGLGACAGKSDGGDTAGGGADGGGDGTDTPACDPGVDADCDGVADGEDCDPDDPLTYPGAAEIPYDGRDNDCAGDGDLVDVDGDGYVGDRAGGDDCNDGNPGVFPGAPEVCYDGLDQNCDGFPASFDEETNDCDGDGHEGRGTEATDCDDEDADVNPDADEIWYDGVDQDCDRNDADQDLDGHTATSAGGDDCDDLDPLVFGGSADEATERLNGKDADCDGTVDNLNQFDADLTWYGTTTSGDFLFGMSVVPLHDVDGDGQRDLLVASPLGGDSAACEEDVGSCGGWLLTLPAGGPGADPPVDAALARAAGAAAGSWMGWDMDLIADVDGDGLADVAVGAPIHGGGGAVLVFSSAELAASDIASPVGPGAAIATLTGDTGMGLQVASVGDLDGDGLDELAGGTGIRLESPTLGSILTPTWVGVWSGSSVAGGGALNAGAAGAALSGRGLGGEVVGGVDLDGDGIPDLLIGDDVDELRDGRVAFLSGADALTAGLVDIADLPLLTGADGAELGGQITLLRDLDGDGGPEVAVAAVGAMGGGALQPAGEVLVLRGADAAVGGPAADLAWAAVHGDTDFAGVVPSGERGGDVDGDGADDLIVAKIGYPGQQLRGGAWIFLGPTIAGGGVLRLLDADISMSTRADGDWYGLSGLVWDKDGDGDGEVFLGGPNGSSSSGMAVAYTSLFVP